MVYSFLKFLPEGKTVSKEKNRKYNSQREREREESALRLHCLSLSLSPKRRQSQRERQTGRDRQEESLNLKIISLITRFQSRSELHPWKHVTAQTEEEGNTTERRHEPNTAAVH